MVLGYGWKASESETQPQQQRLRRAPAETPQAAAWRLPERELEGVRLPGVLLMIEILHYLKDPKLWELA